MKREKGNPASVAALKEQSGTILRRFKRYPAYKDSSVDCLGEIPSHWTRAALARVTFSRCDGPFGTSLKSEHYSSSGVRVIRLQNIGSAEFKDSDEAFIDHNYAGRLGDHSVRAADLLVAGLGDDAHPVGRACVAPDGIEPAIVKADCFRFRLDQRKVLSKFAAFQLSSTASAAAASMATGATRSRMNLTATAARQIVFPIVEEQRAIAAFLDRETARIDALVAKKERLIEVLQEKRTALITLAVTKGLDPHVPVKGSGVEWLDRYPAHWKGLPLKRWVATKITDGPHETPELVSEGVDFISAEAVSNGRIDFDKRRGFISPQLHVHYCRKCRPLRNDILICKSGATTGKLARVDVDFEFSVWSPLALVRPDRSLVLPAFLEMALESEYVQRQIKRTWSAGTQPNISMGDLEQLFVVAPQIEEQTKILEYVKQHAGSFDLLTTQIGEAIERLKELRIALISAAVTGKIDVREEIA